MIFAHLCKYDLAGILRLFFEIKYLLLNLAKVCFGGLNVRDHLLIDIRYEKDITYIEM